MDAGEFYLEKMREIGVEGRAEHTAMLFNLGRLMVAEQIRNRHPETPEAEMTYLVAKQIYKDNPETVRLLDLLHAERIYS